MGTRGECGAPPPYLQSRRYGTQAATCHLETGQEAPDPRGEAKEQLHKNKTIPLVYSPESSGDVNGRPGVHHPSLSGRRESQGNTGEVHDGVGQGRRGVNPARRLDEPPGGGPGNPPGGGGQPSDGIGEKGKLRVSTPRGPREKHPGNPPEGAPKPRGQGGVRRPSKPNPGKRPLGRRCPAAVFLPSPLGRGGKKDTEPSRGDGVVPWGKRVGPQLKKPKNPLPKGPKNRETTLSGRRRGPERLPKWVLGRPGEPFLATLPLWETRIFVAYLRRTWCGEAGNRKHGPNLFQFPLRAPGAPPAAVRPPPRKKGPLYFGPKGARGGRRGPPPECPTPQRPQGARGKSCHPTATPGKGRRGAAQTFSPPQEPGGTEGRVGKGPPAGKSAPKGDNKRAVWFPFGPGRGKVDRDIFCPFQKQRASFGEIRVQIGGRKEKPPPL
ncbi:hypothetical protein GWK47_015198 [Chionoecetes opilio]|uniref:Uncharacterized protein n=1 Tax=Chionoecetes opilio TaxID=41210 RepID=A0A8J4XXH1_CHIOP|nr:hypothetical protein GWK47_015198 [Chionoecetes opilio]